MIYAVATDHCKTTIASEGALTGVATLGRDDVWNVKTAIGVAIIRMYINWCAGAPQADMKNFGHYYLVNVNMAVTTELVARACTVNMMRGKGQQWKTAWQFGTAVPIDILSYERSFREMLKALKDLTGFEAADYPKPPEYNDDPFSS